MSYAYVCSPEVRWLSLLLSLQETLMKIEELQTDIEYLEQQYLDAGPIIGREVRNVLEAARLWLDPNIEAAGRVANNILVIKRAANVWSAPHFAPHEVAAVVAAALTSGDTDDHTDISSGIPAPEITVVVGKVVTITEAARLVADPNIATIERKDIEAATLAWTTIAPYVEIVGSDDFADALSAASLLHFFFEKILPAAFIPGATDE